MVEPNLAKSRHHCNRNIRIVLHQNWIAYRIVLSRAAPNVVHETGKRAFRKSPQGAHDRKMGEMEQCKVIAHQFVQNYYETLDKIGLRQNLTHVYTVCQTTAKHSHCSPVSIAEVHFRRTQVIKYCRLLVLGDACFEMTWVYSIQGFVRIKA